MQCNAASSSSGGECTKERKRKCEAKGSEGRKRQAKMSIESCDGERDAAPKSDAFCCSAQQEGEKRGSGVASKAVDDHWFGKGWTGQKGRRGVGQ